MVLFTFQDRFRFQIGSQLKPPLSQPPQSRSIALRKDYAIQPEVQRFMQRCHCTRGRSVKVNYQPYVDDLEDSSDEFSSFSWTTQQQTQAK